jgi:hypothetical protein
MYCPQCQAEFRDDAGLTQCTECGTTLLPGELPAAVTEPVEDETVLDLVTVLEDADPGILGIAYSLLDQAGIPYSAPADGLQEFLGVGRLGTHYNLLTGPIHVQVRREDEAAARELLADIGADSAPVVASDVQEETD